MTADTTTFTRGKSTRLPSTDINNNSWASQPINVTPNTNYIFGVYLKTSYLYPDGQAFFCAHKMITGWVYLTYIFNFGSDNQIEIMPHLEWANGAVAFDGLNLYPADNPGVNLINVFENFSLQQGIENSLGSKLQNAFDSLTAINTDNRQDAINKLQSFYPSSRSPERQGNYRRSSFHSGSGCKLNNSLSFSIDEKPI